MEISVSGAQIVIKANSGQIKTYPADHVLFDSDGVSIIVRDGETRILLIANISQVAVPVSSSISDLYTKLNALK